MKATLLRPCCTPLFLDAHSNRTTSTRHASFVVCSSSRNQPYIPKLEPFSRTKFERAVKDPPLIEKSEKELSGLLHLFYESQDPFWVGFPFFYKQWNLTMVFIMLCCWMIWVHRLWCVLNFADYCLTLEGEESYSCWQAYFELKDLEVCSSFYTLCYLLMNFVQTF